MSQSRPAGWFPRRGEVYRARLDKARPAVVVSTDALNRHAMDVCVVPLTTVERSKFSLRVGVEPSDGGLDRESWAKCDQVTTLDKGFLIYPPLGKLSASTMERIAQAIKIALELG